MNAVLISIQPYWVFLIIAQKMGWHIDKEKIIEVRKSFPKKQDWNKNAKIYCSKNEQSFRKIPKKYQPLMEKFLGKVIGEFVCDRIDTYIPFEAIEIISKYEKSIPLLKESCLTLEELGVYIGKKVDKNFYGWHISELKIYDKPKELGEFEFPKDNIYLSYRKRNQYFKGIKRPPQLWCYVEELE